MPAAVDCSFNFERAKPLGRDCQHSDKPLMRARNFFAGPRMLGAASPMRAIHSSSSSANINRLRDSPATQMRSRNKPSWRKPSDSVKRMDSVLRWSTSASIRCVLEPGEAVLEKGAHGLGHVTARPVGPCQRIPDLQPLGRRFTMAVVHHSDDLPAVPEEDRPGRVPRWIDVQRHRESSRRLLHVARWRLAPVTHDFGGAVAVMQRGGILGNRGSQAEARGQQGGGAALNMTTPGGRTDPITFGNKATGLVRFTSNADALHVRPKPDSTLPRGRRLRVASPMLPGLHPGPSRRSA